MNTIKRALISVSDKTNILKLAQQLAARGVEILSTGGTAKLLAENDVAVIEVADYTGFAEMMDGRVKTLHPKIHGGLLGRRGVDDAVMAANDIGNIDLLIVNLYPFSQTIAKADCSLADAIENIDIGGPAMLRSAAKNHAAVTVITDPNDYEKLIAEMDANANCSTLETRFLLAQKVFAHTSGYDFAIANYLQQKMHAVEFADNLQLQLSKKQDMRYGENPHQRAAFYVEPHFSGASVATAKQIQGKELSYNNVADTDAALNCVQQFDEPCCVIVKHANPCGVACAQSIGKAYDAAYHTDSESAFGGIIAFNQELDSTTAASIIERQFVEVIIAPSASADAIKCLAQKPNVRLLLCGELSKAKPSRDYKRVTGGLLVQDFDMGEIGEADLKVVSKIAPSSAQLADLLFSWRVAKFVKSNAIVYGKNLQTIGIGAGQMSRVNSARIALIKAEHAKLEVAGAVMASDAFFPFRDGIDNAAKAGISAVIHPGGSLRDQEVIDAADEHGMAMVFTGMRHFRH